MQELFRFRIRFGLVAMLAGSLLACSDQTAPTQAVENQSTDNAAAPAGQPPDAETQIGSEAFKELRNKAEIIVRSPLYGPLKSVTAPIAAEAGRHYNHPFNFILVHEAQPNAFSVPGGNVFVVDSLMYFVKNREELTGVLCHEVAHTLHHDSMKKIQQEKRAIAAEAGALLVLGPTVAHALAIKLLADLRSNGYSRDLEAAADITGSDVCAAAGYNPYGLVWLFEDFKNSGPEVPQLLSDHPSFDARVQALLTHFQRNPAVFSRFSSDRKSATPLDVPKDAPVVFLR